MLSSKLRRHQCRGIVTERFCYFPDLMHQSPRPQICVQHLANITNIFPVFHHLSMISVLMDKNVTKKSQQLHHPVFVHGWSLMPILWISGKYLWKWEGTCLNQEPSNYRHTATLTNTIPLQLKVQNVMINFTLVWPVGWGSQHRWKHASTSLGHDAVQIRPQQSPDWFFMIGIWSIETWQVLRAWPLQARMEIASQKKTANGFWVFIELYVSKLVTSCHVQQHPA